MLYKYKIADLKIQIAGDWNDYAINQAKEYEFDFSDNADISIDVLAEQENISAPKGETILSGRQRHWLSTSGGGAVFYDIVPEISDEIINLIEFDKTFSEIKMSLCKSSVLGLAVDERCFNLCDRVIRLSALCHERVVLHASSIIYNNKAVLFSAPSGTGKSTHTSLWKEYYPETIIFNDDAPIIYADNKTVTAFGSPWCGTSKVNQNASAPLAAIVFLEQSKTCSVRKISGTEAIFKLYTEISKPVYPALMQNMLSKISQILEKVPTYVLSCDISKNAVDTIKNEIGL